MGTFVTRPRYDEPFNCNDQFSRAMKMNSDHRNSKPGGNTSAARTRELPRALDSQGLKLVNEVRKHSVERNSDPYNTSGSFDRKKHWERVGKR